MRRLLYTLAFTASMLVAGCTAPDGEVRRVLEDQGMTQVRLTGHRFFGCGKDDTTKDGFAATSVTGRPVTGVVCGSMGWGKSYTVRFD